MYQKFKCNICAAQSKYGPKITRLVKKICDLGVKYLSDNSDLYIL